MHPLWPGDHEKHTIDWTRGEMTLRGQFSIDDSCYIANTGHFNAVEFNICANQLAYATCAFAMQHKLFAKLAHHDLASFQVNQLPNMLILELNSNFKTPIDAKNFIGTMVIERSMSRRNMIFMRSSFNFFCTQSGSASGTIMFAILDNKKPGVHEPN